MKFLTSLARTYTVSRLRFGREHGGEWPGGGEEVGEGEFHAGLVSSYPSTFLLRLGGWNLVALLSRGQISFPALLRVNFVETRALGRSLGLRRAMGGAEEF